MSISKLVYRIAKDHGITALAEDCGINLNTFKNKVNPNIDTHHLYAEELDLIATMADTDAVAEYFAEQRGMMCIKKTVFEDVSDKPILNLILAGSVSHGAWADVIMKAFEDDVISWDDLIQIKARYEDVCRADAEVMNRLTGCMAVAEERRSRRNS